MEVLGYVLGFGYGAMCLLSAFLLSRFGVDKRITRKIVHIFIGFEWAILYLFHGTSYHFLIVCLAFLALLAFAYKKKLLKMISSDGENAPGTVYYAVSMSIMALTSLFEPRFILPFGVAVFATSMGDGFAGLLGQLVKKHNPKIYRQKTLFGCLLNFVFSSTSALVFMFLFPDMKLSLLFCLAIGLLSAGVELITGLGLDNVSVPLSVSAFTYFITVYSDVAVFYFLPIILTPFVIAFVIRKNVLTKDGVFAAVFLDVAVSLTLGNMGFALLLSFLVLGVLTDKLKRRNMQDIEEKGDKRDFCQVLSNGLVPIVSAILYFYLGNRAFFIAFLASLSEALADTAASSLGSYSKTTFDIFKFRKCERGMSGGVSGVGTLAAIVFSFIIPAISAVFKPISIIEILFVAVIAMLGVFFDSLLGSLIQAKYRCTVCSTATEKPIHCGKSSELYSGVSFVRNDIVNALSTFFAAVFAVVFYNTFI